MTQAKELAAARRRSAVADESAAEAALRRAQLAVPNLIEDGVPAGGEDDYVVCKEVGDKPAFAGFTPGIMSDSGGCSAPSIPSAVPRCPVRGSTSSPARARCCSSPC
ncbi:MAG: hypothetical protein WKF47_05375 [Geodermatophilaceae bacterium]